MVTFILGGIMRMFEKPQPKKVEYKGKQVEPIEIFESLFNGNGQAPFQREAKQ